MGIDIYLKWEGQTDEQAKAQFTGFSVTSGHVGYLREAYHGGPYVTEFLCREAFDEKAREQGDDGAVIIPAAVLKERLPEAKKLAIERERKVYHETDPKKIAPVVKAFVDFVKLAEKMEKATGKPCSVYASY